MRKFAKMQGVLSSAILILVAAGCAFGPKIDWNGRIGKYTYDQAITELGPPDKSADLANGVRVAEWLTQRGYDRGGFLSGAPGPFIHYYQISPSPDYFLRLTFGPDRLLQAWKQLAK